MTVFGFFLASWGFRNELASHALVHLAAQQGWKLKIHELSIQASPWRISLDSLDVQHDMSETRIKLNDLRLQTIHWDRGNLSMDSLTFDSLVVQSKRWEELLDESESEDASWPDALSGVALNALEWNGILVGASDTMGMALEAGAGIDIQADPTGWHVQSLGWHHGWAAAKSWPDTLQLERTSASGSNRGGTWRCEVQHLDLPGVHLEGVLTWPLDSASGDLEVEWDKVEPWASAFLAPTANIPWQLLHQATELSWTQSQDNWNVDIGGTHWLNLVASGDATSWQFVTSVPGAIMPEDMPASCRQWDLVASGTWNENHEATWPSADGAKLSLRGDDQVDLNMSWSTKTPLEGAMPWEIPSDWTMTILAWPGMVRGGQDTLFVGLNGVADNFEWDVQGQTTVASIHGNGRLNEQSLAMNVDIANWLPSIESSSIQLDGEIDFGPQWTSMNGLLVARSPWWGDNDSLIMNASIPDMNSLQDASANLVGAGLDLTASGSADPSSWLRLWENVKGRKTEVHWPETRIHAKVHDNQWIPQITGHQWGWQNVMTLDMDIIDDRLTTSLHLDGWNWGEINLGETNLVVDGTPEQLFANLQLETGDHEGEWWPQQVTADVRADTAWFVNLNWDHESWKDAEWSIEAIPGEDEWQWTLYQGQIPLVHELLVVQETPFSWTASPTAPLPPSLTMAGLGGFANMRTRPFLGGGQAVQFQARFPDIERVTATLAPDLELGTLGIDGIWDPNTASATAFAETLKWHGIVLDRVEGDLKLRPNRIGFGLEVMAEELDANASATGRLNLPELQFSKTSFDIQNIPMSWTHAWIDPETVELSGTLDARIDVEGSPQAPLVSGSGNVNNLNARVASLGTSFGGSGDVIIEPDGFTMNNWLVHDQEGETFRVYGALMHEQFQEWNLDLNCLESQNALHIMDLPSTPEATVYGTLFGKGSFGVFFWGNQILIDGEVDILGPTQAKLPLYVGATSTWNDVVQFTRGHEEESLNAPSDEEAPINLEISLNIDVERDAEMTLVMDEINDANMVGQMEGHLDFHLKDWEHMDLRGDLTIVDGRYDFALGQFLRKKFVAKPGGKLTWDGDPYEGSMALDAVYQTRANIAPVIGSLDAGQQFEGIDVILHLSGPMLEPNISFDLQAPNASALNQEALASALVDENDVTSQAIALLSLQEFIPAQVNGLQLGAEGLQENSIDLIASQVSGWLSRVNDDVEVGISYDALDTGDDASDIISQQDALQLAMKAKFLNDKLEVEGAFGSKDLSQEALSQAHLQNLRVLYNLNDDHSLQLTGFSEAQTSATQNANSTTQGIGLRWHQSFNWSWPWRQSKDEKSASSSD